MVVGSIVIALVQHMTTSMVEYETQALVPFTVKHLQMFVFTTTTPLGLAYTTSIGVTIDGVTLRNHVSSIHRSGSRASVFRHEAGHSMSRSYVELDVVQRHIADLNQAIGAAPTNPVLFGQQLAQHGFAVQATVNGIVNTLGVTDYQKGSQLLNLVDSRIRTAGTKENARRYFNDFLMIILGPMGHHDITESLVATFRKWNARKLSCNYH